MVRVAWSLGVAGGTVGVGVGVVIFVLVVGGWWWLGRGDGGGGGGWRFWVEGGGYRVYSEYTTE